MVIVSSVAFSHRKVARQISEVVGDSLVITHNEPLMVFSNQMIYVGTIDWYSVGCASRYAVGSKRKIFYGVAEGIPVLTDESHRILEMFRIVVPTEYVRWEAENVGLTVESIVPHAVRTVVPNVRAFRKLRRQWSSKKARYFVGWIGANQYRKALDIVFDVASKLPSEIAVVVITGYGEIPLDTVPENVILYRNIYSWSESDIAAFYQSIDAYLGITRGEGFGITVYEALAYGKPVIAPDILVFKPIRKYLVTYDVQKPRLEPYMDYIIMRYYEPKSVSEIAQAIYDTVVRKPDMTDASREIREKYSPERVYSVFKTGEIFNYKVRRL